MEVEQARPAGHVFAENTIRDNARAHFGDNINYNYTVNTYYLHRQRGIEIGDDDRIGVPEAFRGLYSQITSLISRLQGISFEGTVISYAGRSALNELTSCQTTLRELKRALAEADLSLERASLIQAQHLIISLTDGILILDALQSAVVPEVVRGGAYEHGSATVMHLLRRLQAQGLIWKTQLRILVCEHDLDAHKQSLTLDEQVAKVLGDNQNLQDRLTAMEDRLNELSEGASIRLPVSMPPKSRAVSIVSREPAKTARSIHSKARTFERILAKTKVYRRNEQRSEVFSVQSSAGRSYAWSECSISDASTLSVIALPIKISELASGELYRSKRTLALVDIDLEMDHQSLMEDSDDSGSESRSHRAKHFDVIRPRDHIEQALLEQSRLDWLTATIQQQLKEESARLDGSENDGEHRASPKDERTNEEAKQYQPLLTVNLRYQGLDSMSRQSISLMQHSVERLILSRNHIR